MPEWNLAPLGPRHRARLSRALGDLRRLSQSRVELLGSTLDATPYRHVIYDPLLDPSPTWHEAWKQLGESHGWLATPQTLPTLLSDIASVQTVLSSCLPTTDRRTTPTPGDPDPNHHWSILAAEAPVGTTRLIVAERIVSTCLTSSQVSERVFLAYGSSTRESFPALRRAAALFPPTEHLGPRRSHFTVGNRTFQVKRSALEASSVSGEPIHEYPIEHRERNVHGAGNYLKAGPRHAPGWLVRSYPLDFLPTWGPPPTPYSSIKPPYRLSQRDDLYIATTPRLTRPTFKALQASVSAFHGFYVSPRGSSPHGWAFKSHDDLLAFASQHLGPPE